MGDDRHGRAPGPGGRAPWERYPTADNPERDGARTSRRSRHTDGATDAGSAPLTVQDLVEKVDSERIGRRRRADAGGRPDRRAETAPGSTAPAHPADPAASRRAPEGPAPQQRRAPEGPQRGAPQSPQRGAPENVQRGPQGARRDAPDTAQRGAPDTARRSAPEGAQRGAPEATQRGGPETTQRRPPDSAQRRAPEGQRGAPNAPLRNAAQAPPRRAPESTPAKPAPGARPEEAAAKRRAAAQAAPGRQARRAPSVVVDDITGSSPAAPPRRAAEPAEPAEEVTDVLPPLDEPEGSATEKWPTTESAATPKPAAKSATSKIAAPSKSVGGPPLSRLAASKQRRDRRLKTAGRVSAALVAVLVLVITGGGWSYMRSTTNNFTQVSALDENSEDVIDSNAQLGDENYLLVGTDTRAGANGQLGAGTLDDAEGSRADTTMLVHLPKDRSRVVIMSFPRDLDVTRPQCNGWDGNKSYTKEKFPSAIGDKLNAVYNLGGPMCLVSTIQRLTGASINHFIAIDFAGFETMVDQIDGVEVCATKPLVDGVLGTILEQPGKQRINGETALNYVRARHVYGEERSDYDRINRQQRFLASLLRGALASKMLFDLGKLNGFIKEFTNHTLVDEKTRPEDLLMLGRSLQNLDAGTVTFLTVPTAGTTTYGNEIPRESDIKAIFKAIRDDQPLPGEKPTAHDDAPAPAPAAPTPTKYTAVDPSTVSLLVSNGSGYDGLARTAATKLGNQGFTIYNTANYANGTSQTTKVRYGAGLEAEAATVATSIPGATIEAADDLGGIVEVVVGVDSANGVVVKAPTPVGDAITNVVTSTSTDSKPVELPSDLEHVNAGEEVCK
ncbi:LCP family glycopolymer transferase [Nocardia sp. bgisy118]|uniref:LCP family glycopolymer transferase n=1 Tax=Nocardia sp. bgisy118 TaxID=3413786 RepID=UPI003F4A46A1